ncbi:MAG: ABC transporter ATP-binding protein [Candidatus Nephthysia bennettiae]|uniref:ABC transporter ATP-binding protein n=1 Tax=Candidatus Nephthysia bennettiae TaxID=3127016 RepID=A0A934KAP8_9BACT|nr:ABC transporter ATP-binding protein [Candidatus Dormibacteraeota bacterium]MBJ7610929.1 ABC transporter ATP-binding protein [Candidatus Dormibacteraeota bacterium]PZR98849.1 MAG: ABC transporter ATP-binding protein [Candidatus Dormibacteraeota bacterium]
MALLELQDVQASYGPIKALHGVDIEVEQGSIVALLGANGAGKTTTLRSISGMVRTAGHVRFDGRDIVNKPPEEVARLGVAHVPEGRGTLAQLTVWENLQMGAYVRRDRGRIGEDLERVCGYFPWIRERRRQVAALLSGGEQQMLAIARALMLRPRLLLLDEPSLGLSPMIVRGIFGIVEAINREQGLTVLIVEQNANLALQVASRAYLLEVGRVVLEGGSDELARNDSVRRSYLGY